MKIKILYPPKKEENKYAEINVEVTEVPRIMESVNLGEGKNRPVLYVVHKVLKNEIVILCGDLEED